MSIDTPFFSIITVSLNAGAALEKTAFSVLEQDHGDYEYLVQDGGSQDGSLDALPERARLGLVVEKDEGIYDAMNRAVARAQGSYLHFLNAGDRYPNAQTLSRVAAAIQAAKGSPDLLYGAAFDERSRKLRSAAAVFGRKRLYLEGICHQAQWIRRDRFLQLGGFDLSYRFRADHELLLRLAETGAQTIRLGETLALYDGRGFSAVKKNRAALDAEWRLLRQTRFTSSERLCWGFLSACRMLWLKRLLLDLGIRRRKRAGGQ